MSLSITCIEQQQKDRRTVKKFVIYGLLCSTILHAGVLALAISGMLDRPPEQQEEDAIELIFVEEQEEAPPEPEPEEKVEEPEPEEIVEEPEPEEIVEEQEVIPPEPLETAIAQPQEILPPEIPTETAISETVEPSSPEQPTETALEPIEQPQQLEPIPEPEPFVAEPIAQPNPSAAAFSPDSIAEVQQDSASTPETASDSFSAPIAANIPPEIPRPQVAEVTQPSFEEPSSNLSSSLSQQSSFEDVSSNIDNTQSSLSSPIETERSVPRRLPAAVGTQPSVSPTNSNVGSSLSEQSDFGDVARNSANPGSSNSQFGSPLSSDTTGEGSRPSLPGEVGTQPTASGQSNSGIGDALSGLGNFEDGTGRNLGNPGSGELAAVGSPLGDSGGSRGRPGKPSSGSGSKSGSGSGGVSCVDCPQPDYPSLAREQGLEGNPKLRIDIDFDGNVTNVYIEKSSGHPILDEAAIEAVKEWKLDPKDGGRIGVLVTLRFRLR